MPPLKYPGDNEQESHIQGAIDSSVKKAVKEAIGPSRDVFGKIPTTRIVYVNAVAR